MKAQLKYMVPVATVAAVGLASMLTCVAGPTVVITPPTVVVTAPAPPVVVAPPVAVEVVPDSYAWDGDEYVGVVGDQYYYLGPGNVWMVMDAPRLGRFHTWEHAHADWRDHAVHNVKYRNHAPAHVQPAHVDDHHDSHPDNHDNGDHHDHNPPQ